MLKCRNIQLFEYSNIQMRVTEKVLWEQTTNPPPG